jgi:hypothetical protein
VYLGRQPSAAASERMVAGFFGLILFRLILFRLILLKLVLLVRRNFPLFLG